jgi:hypothetical protein
MKRIYRPLYFPDDRPALMMHGNYVNHAGKDELAMLPWLFNNGHR